MPRLYRLYLLLPVLAACHQSPAPDVKPMTYTTVSTLAGDGHTGYVDGPGAAAEFNFPEGVAADAQGNVYVADGFNACIRKITPAGLVSTLAGTGQQGYHDGPAASATFGHPTAIALDAQGTMYVADGDNNCIRKLTPAGVVSTLAGNGTYGYADGPAASAQFRYPRGLTIDGQGNLYVADFGNGSIRRVTPAGVVSTLAGNGQRGYAEGQGSQARFEGPRGLAIDQQGTLYVADAGNYRVRRVLPNGTTSTLAGTGSAGAANGSGNSAQFNSVIGVAVDGQGTVYAAEAHDNTIRRIAADGTVSTLAGTGQLGAADGALGTAQFSTPVALALDAAGNLLIAEYGMRIRRISGQ